MGAVVETARKAGEEKREVKRQQDRWQIKNKIYGRWPREVIVKG
jgi:hypothetical protein